MRESKNIYSARLIVSKVASVIYKMAPHNRPRDISKIMSYVADEVDKKCVDLADNRHVFMTCKQFDSWVSDTLMTCPEFRNLNLSQNEFDSGVLVDDDSRPKFAFHSRYDVETEDSWKDDFIDLDACVGNICYEIAQCVAEEPSCCICENCDTEICNSCSENYKNLYSHTNKPWDITKFDGWCDTRCPRGVAVCCKDCIWKKQCTLPEKCEDYEWNLCTQYMVKLHAEANSNE